MIYRTKSGFYYVNKYGASKKISSSQLSKYRAMSRRETQRETILKRSSPSGYLIKYGYSTASQKKRYNKIRRTKSRYKRRRSKAPRLIGW